VSIEGDPIAEARVRFVHLDMLGTVELRRRLGERSAQTIERVSVQHVRDDHESMLVEGDAMGIEENHPARIAPPFDPIRVSRQTRKGREPRFAVPGFRGPEDILGVTAARGGRTFVVRSTGHRATLVDAIRVARSNAQS
jgi:hypothetical protein